MKLVIHTQYCENYAAHTWNGEGECPQRWKNKGGEVYVVDNITPAQAERIEREGIPTIAKLIQYSNDGSKEFVAGYDIVADDAREGAEWETPFRLVYLNGKWAAQRAVDNTGEYGGAYRREIKTKFESFFLLPGGERDAYNASYELVNGRVALDAQELQCELEMMEAA